ncbi:MAG TPA: cytochrome c biogenesis protein DipZ [Gaiellaceae bacterium]|nr:cytochrome c biogenesis protein DipZ [Gaiellaceae bacterium]
MDARFLLLLPIAFGAGIVTAISPCVFPVLPILFAGGASGGRRRPYAIIAGLVASFATFTLVATWLLEQLHLPQDFLRDLSIALLLVLAATLIVPRFGVLLERPLAFLSRRAPSSDLGGGFLLGASLGLVFVPCGGPVIGAISANAARLEFGTRTVAITLAYALGAAVPMLAVAVLGQRATGRIRANAVQLRAAVGVLMALAALAIAFDADRKLQTWFPDYTHALQGAERSSVAQDELAKLQHRGASPFRAGTSGSLPDYGRAPDFTGISAWLHSRPLTLERLRGKVVLVDFWTYSCINCIRTLPHLEAWDRRYRKAGLVIVGVHTPEFAFEHVVSNVRAASRDLGVRYPVAIDNGYHTWNAYRNDAWPAEYLIDRRGNVREIKKGEGRYDETERSIRTLLGERGAAQLASVRDRTPQHLTTPESYLGWLRLERYVGSPITPDREAAYAFPRAIPLNDLAYAGRWQVERERVVAGRGARLRLHFLAQDVYLVLSGRGRLQVLVGGRPVKTLRVSGLSRLYTLLRYPGLSEGALELRFTPGIAAYAFTFG